MTRLACRILPRCLEIIVGPQVRRRKAILQVQWDVFMREVPLIDNESHEISEPQAKGKDVRNKGQGKRLTDPDSILFPLHSQHSSASIERWSIAPLLRVNIIAPRIVRRRTAIRQSSRSGCRWDGEFLRGGCFNSASRRRVRRVLVHSVQVDAFEDVDLACVRMI